jgi:hypothetical protein
MNTHPHAHTSRENQHREGWGQRLFMEDVGEGLSGEPAFKQIIEGVRHMDVLETCSRQGTTCEHVEGLSLAKATVAGTEHTIREVSHTQRSGDLVGLREQGWTWTFYLRFC